MIKLKVVDYCVNIIFVIIIAMLIINIRNQHNLNIALKLQMTDSVQKSVIVSPNLPCPNCGNTIYQAFYDPNINSNEVFYTCCECNYILLISDFSNANHRAALLKMFKQDYSKWKEKFDKYDIDKAFIATFTYVNPFFNK